MALFNEKETFLKELAKHGVMGLANKYHVTHGAIMYYKRKWDENRKVKKTPKMVIQNDVVIATDVYGRIFKFDVEDIDKVTPYNWYVHQNYVKAMKGKKTLLLHRVILGCDDKKMVVDHINHDKSDNRKANLRVVTQSQNIQNRGLIPNNTSGITGVHWHEHTHKWKAEIEVNGKKHYLGVFKDINDAKKARQEAEKKYFGEYAYKN